jgi:predicted amidohydrolase
LEKLENLTQYLPMRIALPQFSISSSIDKNLENALHWIKQAAARQADLVLLPEGHLLPYFPQKPNLDASAFLLDEDSAEIRQFQAAARKHRISVVPNIYLRSVVTPNKGYAASPFIEADGTILGWAKKLHITRSEKFFEADYFLPSDIPIPVYPAKFGRVAILICFDRHYPECWQAIADLGADLVLIPTGNIKNEPLELFEWELRVAARRYGCYVAMCNRIGWEEDMHFCGESLIISPQGNVIARGGEEEILLLANIDISISTDNGNGVGIGEQKDMAP